MDILKKLRSKGYRITSQREKILKEIYEHPLTVDEIFASLKKKKIRLDLASVYRTLQLFTKNTIVQEVQFGDGKKRYELVNEKNHHHHIVCNNCGTVENVILPNEERLIKTIAESSQFQIVKHTLEFFGLCAKCS